MEELLNNPASLELYQYKAIGAICMFCIAAISFMFVYFLRSKDKDIQYYRDKVASLENCLMEEVSKRENLQGQIRDDLLENVKAIIAINTTLKNMQNEQHKRGT